MNRIQEIFVHTANGTTMNLQIVEDEAGQFCTIGVLTNNQAELVEWFPLVPNRKLDTAAGAFENLANSLMGYCQRHADTVLAINNQNNTDLLSKHEQEDILSAYGIVAAVKVNGV